MALQDRDLEHARSLAKKMRKPLVALQEIPHNDHSDLQHVGFCLLRSIIENPYISARPHQVVVVVIKGPHCCAFTMDEDKQDQVKEIRSLDEGRIY